MWIDDRVAQNDGRKSGDSFHSVSAGKSSGSCHSPLVCGSTPSELPTLGQVGDSNVQMHYLHENVESFGRDNVNFGVTNTASEMTPAVQNSVVTTADGFQFGVTSVNSLPTGVIIDDLGSDNSGEIDSRSFHDLGSQSLMVR